MSFKPAATVVVLVTASLLPAALRAEPTVQALPLLQAKPQRCVALHKGQTCFQKLKMHWQVAEVGDYCLRERLHEKLLFCWGQSREGRYEVVFEAADNRFYQLVNKVDFSVIAEIEIKVAWVYRSNKRKHSSWRLF